MPASPYLRAYFGDKVINAGFLVLPHLLVRHYHQLGLSEEMLVFALHLPSIVWDYADPPHNLRDIAKRMGKSLSTVRGYGHALNQAGLVIIRERWKEGQQIGNDYDLSPLWSALAAFVPDAIEDETGITIGPPLVAHASEPSADGGEHLFRGRRKTGGRTPSTQQGSHRKTGGGPPETRRRAAEKPVGLTRKKTDQDLQERKEPPQSPNTGGRQDEEQKEVRELLKRLGLEHTE